MADDEGAVADSPKKTDSDKKYKEPLAVTAEECSSSMVKVVMVIPGLAVEKSILKGFVNKPKNAEVIVNIKERSLDVSVALKDKKKGTLVNYKAQINKLPGAIVPEKCKTEYKKEQVILSLFKKDEDSWAVQLSQSGLDQEPDED